jgi:competence protein ComEC
MRHFRRVYAYAFTLFLLPVLLIAQQATGTLKIRVLNVGQGDAIYIECPEPAHHNMLIDSGDVTAMRYPGSPKLFQEQLAELMGTRKRIDVVISSHPHSDHAGSLLWVLSTYDVGKFIDDGMQYESATHTKIDLRAKELAGQGKLKFLHATDLPNKSKEPDFCPAANVDAILLKPAGFGQEDNPNNNSVAIRINYNDQTFLFTGDGEDEEEALLLKDPATRPLLASTVLKAPHHGSNTSSTADFLAAVQPKIVVVSAGEKDIGTNKGYKHPRAETITRFLGFTKANGTADLRTIDAYDTDAKKWTEVQINAGVYVTAVDGTITIASDGTKTWKGEEGPELISENAPVRYVYTKADSEWYHLEECAVAKRIKPENRIVSKTPPEGREMHRGCPR